MKVYKVFKREEIENALEKAGLPGDSFWDCLGDNFCNDVAVSWWVESPYEDDPEYEELEKSRKIINEYMISQGCSIDETVYIDITW